MTSLLTDGGNGPDERVGLDLSFDGTPYCDGSLFVESMGASVARSSPGTLSNGAPDPVLEGAGKYEAS